MPMIALLCVVVDLSDQQYFEIVSQLTAGGEKAFISGAENANAALFVFYTALCPRCGSVQELTGRLSESGVLTYTIDCASQRRACAAYRGQKAPLAVLHQNGVEHTLGSGELSPDALLQQIMHFQSPVALLSADEAFEKIQDSNLDVYVVAEVCIDQHCDANDTQKGRLLLRQLERWRDDRAVLFQVSTRNQLTAHRQGVILKSSNFDAGAAQEFVGANLKPLLEGSDYRVFSTQKRHAVIFTTDQVIIDELLVYVRTLHIGGSALLDEYEFFVSRSLDQQFQVYYDDFPFVLVLQQDMGYYIQNYQSTHHLNRLLNDIIAGKEDPLYVDPDNEISSTNNIQIKYINADDENEGRRRWDDDEDEEDGAEL